MLNNNEPNFKLPGKLEKILAILVASYGTNNEPVLGKLIVNSQYRVEERTAYDPWDGGQYGHTIHFDVLPSVYHPLIGGLQKVADKLSKDINSIANCPGEFIEKVIIDPQEDPNLKNWREDSGLLLSRRLAVALPSGEDLSDIWIPGYLRIFLSHKAEYKQETAKFKEACLRFGFSCFVAHEDIEPNMEWQKVIEKALFSMEAMALLMTDKFHDSRWTDQEIGVAIGREIPIVPIGLGMDPYGFIGKYQALPGKNKAIQLLAEDLFNLLFSIASLNERAAEALIVRFENVKSYDEANRMMGYLEKINNAPPQIIDRLENSVKKNSQVRRAFEVEKRLPSLINRLKKRLDRD